MRTPSRRPREPPRNSRRRRGCTVPPCRSAAGPPAAGSSGPSLGRVCQRSLEARTGSGAARGTLACRRCRRRALQKRRAAPRCPSSGSRRGWCARAPAFPERSVKCVGAAARARSARQRGLVAYCWGRGWEPTRAKRLQSRAGTTDRVGTRPRKSESRTRAP